MKIYNYDSVTGEFLGTSEARLGPVEKMEGRMKYLIPAYATDVAPPEVEDGDGQTAMWDETVSAWKTVEDHRGETVYDTGTGRSVMLTDLGQLPGNITVTAPGNCQKWDESKKAWVTDIETLSETIRAERDSRLAVCDWTQAIDSPLSDGMKAEWQIYRQALRDIPEQDGFPDDVNWPDEPEETATDN